MRYKMKFWTLLLTCFLIFSVQSEEISADQLEGLSECDYFKYTQCTTAGLNIGACVNKKYDAFVAKCGQVHADNYMYSREMFKPKLKKSKKKNCKASQDKLCMKSGLSLGECVKKHGKELKESCGSDFIDQANKQNIMEECVSLQKKMCGDEINPECQVAFEAKAPKKCTGKAEINDAGPKGGVSTKAVMDDCMPVISKSKCVLDDKAMEKEGKSYEAMKKYELCLKKALLSAKGKCGSHIPSENKWKKEVDGLKSGDWKTNAEERKKEAQALEKKVGN